MRRCTVATLLRVLNLPLLALNVSIDSLVLASIVSGDAHLKSNDISDLPRL
jgi:hypothetical protein